MYLPPYAEVICKNAILSKYAARHTQYFEVIQYGTFKVKFAVNAENFICDL